MGKLFRIINSRTKFEEYDEDVYTKYMNDVRKYHSGEISLI